MTELEVSDRLSGLAAAIQTGGCASLAVPRVKVQVQAVAVSTLPGQC